MTSTTETTSAGRIALDSDWGVIRAVGSDAAAFLQGQLTNDVVALSVGQAMLAGWCSAKGRLLASFVVWRSGGDEFGLACSRDLQAATLKRLSMFVLRAACRLGDVGVAPAVAIGDAVPQAVRTQPPMRIADGWLRWPDVDGVARAWRLPATNDDAVTSVAADASTLEVGRWLEVRSGVPRIVAATMDAFVPQMVNLELVGGVNFRKGCYPGQEVVARSQYRGTLKRRMHLFSCSEGATAGQEVFHDSDAAQPSGTVVNGASRGAQHAVLVSLKTALFDEPGAWRLGSAQGPVLERTALPYDVPREAADI